MQLHNHTCYSLLDSIVNPKDLPKWAKENNYSAIGVSEHGNIHSQIIFYKECIKNNIKPILGVEAYVTDDITIKDKDSRYDHLLIIVKNEEGRVNLNKLITKSYLEGFYFKPRISTKMLEEYKNGLIISSACLGSELCRYLFNNKYDEAKKLVYYYKKLFNDDYYLEMQSHNREESILINKLILKLSKETNTPFIITNDTHYLKGQSDTHNTFIQISQDRDVEEQYAGCYLMTVDEIHKIMDKQIGQENVNEGIKNTNIIADKCNVEIKLNCPELPHISLPNNYTEESYMKHLINEGFKKKNIPSHKKQEYIERIRYEYDIINKKGFLGYFLIVKDFIQWAKNNNILVGPARGSAAGSLISNLLGITQTDPLKFGLLFERFLNPERSALPDIDIDLSDKQKVVNYLKDKYGHDNVGQIGNFLPIQAKATIKDVGRVLGMSYDIRESISKLIPDNTKKEENFIKKSLEVNKQLREFQNKYPKLFEYSLQLEGTPKSFSVHPCGVVIGAKPISHYTSLALSKDKEEVLHLEMHSTEDIGLVKIDLLGLETLSLIKNTLEMINESYDMIHPDNINLNDEKTWELLQNAETDGVFQLESPGMKQLLKDFSPTSIEDLSVINATYRPALLKLGIDKTLISRKKGNSNIEYLHPILEPILNNTYGILLYQESFMQISKIMAGFTDAQADYLRKACGKKDVELMTEQKDRFINGCLKNGYEKELVEKIWEMIDAFGGYGFNKSHSISYSLIGYQTAHLKVHYPIPFMTCLLNLEKGNYQQLSKYLIECERMNIQVLPPSINNSEVNFSISENKILFGLSTIKNVGDNNVDIIIKNRPYKSFRNFTEKVTVDVSTLISLIKGGAFDEFNNNREELLLEYANSLYVPLIYKDNISINKKQKELLIEKNIILESDYKNKELCLRKYNEYRFNEHKNKNKNKYEKHIEDFKNKYLTGSKEDWEFEVLSVYLTGNPYKEIEKQLVSFDDVNDNAECIIVGTIIDIKNKSDKNKNKFCYINIFNHESKIIESVCWATQYNEYYEIIKKGVKIACLGKKKEGKYFIKKIRLYDEWIKKYN